MATSLRGAAIAVPDSPRRGPKFTASEILARVNASGGNVSLAATV